MWFNAKPNFENFSCETAFEYTSNCSEEVSYKILKQCHVSTPFFEHLLSKQLESSKAEKSFAYANYFLELEEVNKEMCNRVENYVSGHCHLSKGNYVEYIRGNTNVVILAPHGGSMRPNEISDRERGVKEGDGYTMQVACDIGLRKFPKNWKIVFTLFLFKKGYALAALTKDNRTFHFPHIVVMHLRSSKLFLIGEYKIF